MGCLEILILHQSYIQAPPPNVTILYNSFTDDGQHFLLEWHKYAKSPLHRMYHNHLSSLAQIRLIDTGKTVGWEPVTKTQVYVDRILLCEPRGHPELASRLKTIYRSLIVYSNQNSEGYNHHKREGWFEAEANRLRNLYQDIENGKQ